MFSLIERFQKDAKKLGRDENSIEEFKGWLSVAFKEESDRFYELVGRTLRADDERHEVYFADDYIELIHPDGKHYIDQFPYLGDDETVEGTQGYELYYNDVSDYLEFIKNNKIIATLHL